MMTPMRYVVLVLVIIVSPLHHAVTPAPILKGHVDQSALHPQLLP